MSYVDGFVLVVPKKKVSAYRNLARKAARMWKQNGAVEYFECMGDDLHPKTGGPPLGFTFPKMAKARRGETVWFSFIVYKSRAHRDRVNAKVMKLMDESMSKQPMPFDLKRLAWGGFKAIVEA